MVPRNSSCIPLVTTMTKGASSSLHRASAEQARLCSLGPRTTGLPFLIARCSMLSMNVATPEPV
jgi:hypothetical protein